MPMLRFELFCAQCWQCFLIALSGFYNVSLMTFSISENKNINIFHRKHQFKSTSEIKKHLNCDFIWCEEEFEDNQRGNQNPYIEEQITQWPKEKVQRTNNALQSIHIKLNGWTFYFKTR
jgi:hypothetical protein